MEKHQEVASAGDIEHSPAVLPVSSVVMNEKPVDQELEDLFEQEIGEPVSPKSRRDERFLAFHLVYAVDRFDYELSLTEIAQHFRSGFEVAFEDDAYAMQIAQGAINEHVELDKMIKPVLKHWKFERLGCCTRLILRMAVWEMKQLNAIPSIIMNEAVELAKAFCEKDAYRFINGILDQVCKKNFAEKLEKEKETKPHGKSAATSVDKKGERK